MVHRRIKWIDTVRGIAIIMIVIGHSLDVYTRSYFAAFLFAVHVPIFFVVSGYLYKAKPTRKVLIGSLKNLILPYLVTTIFVAVIEFLGHNIFPNWINAISLKPYILSVFYGLGTHAALPSTNIYIPAIGAIWFLPAMFLGNILFNWVYKLSHRYKQQNGMLVLISLLLTILGFVLGTKIQLPWSFDASLISQSFYCFGYLVKQVDLVEKGNWTFNAAGLILWLLSAKSGFFYLNVAHADSPAMAILGAFGASYFMMRSCCWLAQKHVPASLIQRFGRDSMVILCFHLIDLNTFRVGPSVLNHIFLATGSKILGIGSFIAYRLLFCMLAVLVVPKIPFIRSLFSKDNFRLELSESGIR